MDMGGNGLVDSPFSNVGWASAEPIVGAFIDRIEGGENVTGNTTSGGRVQAWRKRETSDLVTERSD